MPTIDRRFWSEKRVLITGHTGFKGAWLSAWLGQLGSEVFGFSLPPAKPVNLYSLLDLRIHRNFLGDLRDHHQIFEATKQIRPHIVFHLAAQPLVRTSYAEPVETVSTNVLGTTHLLNALREIDCLEAILVITSDKVYDNNSTLVSNHKFREDEPLGGKDPYSASKAMQELVTKSFFLSYFRQKNVSVATARAGNVIGGGDWSDDRLMSDLVIAINSNQDFMMRNPQFTRPWQHVLEPLSGYLIFAEKMAKKHTNLTALNFGPNISHTVLDVVNKTLKYWGSPINLTESADNNVFEASSLDIDSSLAKKKIGWESNMSLDETIQLTVDWYKGYYSGANVADITESQIINFQKRLM